MGVQEQNSRRGLRLGQSGNALVTLIAINAIVFCALNLIKMVYLLSGKPGLLFETQALTWFHLPANLSTLATRPWTVITYMFSHIDAWHLIMNMLWLWMFGYIMQDLTGNRKIGPLYLYGGVAGAIIFLVFFNVFPGLIKFMPGGTLIGASAGVMAVAIGTTTLAPDYRIFPMIHGGIPLWVLTLVFVAIDLASVASGNNPGGSLAHLAGAGIGFLYVKRLQRGKDWGEWMHKFSSWFLNLFNPAKNKPDPKVVRSEMFYQPGPQKPYRKTSHVTQQRVDELLDKINNQGYHFLSDEEKEYLKRASKEDI